ncbi:MAG TPA: DUF4365 domain-containing protein [Kofleriaceae bacterium]|nr:DUF4365 domain-containing protein [Kofleriaceae bacterium]
MLLGHQQEEFSRAYVYAVAAAAGFKYSPAPSPDDDSVDVMIAARGLRGTSRSPKLDLQCKCRFGDPSGDPIAYPLKQKNYDDLRHSDFAVPRILVVLFVPETPIDWTTHTDRDLTLRHCAYWVSLRGAPETANEHTTTVFLPRQNTFSVAGLTAIMDRIGQGGVP